MHEFGTPAQADLIVKLAFKTGKISTDKHAAVLRARVLAMPQVKVREEITRLNKLVGFAPKSSLATEKQIGFIRDLEKKLNGLPRTSGNDRLTYADADARIKLLKSEIAAASADVTEENLDRLLALPKELPVQQAEALGISVLAVLELRKLHTRAGSPSRRSQGVGHA